MCLAPGDTARGDVDASANGGDGDPSASVSAVAAQDESWPRCSRPVE